MLRTSWEMRGGGFQGLRGREFGGVVFSTLRIFKETFD